VTIARGQWERPQARRYEYYAVGLKPVRVGYDALDRKFMAEVPDRNAGALVIDNEYLGDIDKGEEVREIDQTEFEAMCERIYGRAASER
jgi:hypothetical protein